MLSSRPGNVAKALAALPAGAQGETVDVQAETEVRALFDRLGAFDHLVYTAGEAMAPARVADTEISKIRQFFEIRFWGAYASVKYGAPYIRSGGSIVLSSGTASQRPGPGWAQARRPWRDGGVGRALAVELAPVRVNVVRAGMTRTDFWQEFPAPVREEMFRATGAALPVGRIGESDDVARCYVYLMEQEFTTGSVVTVDGGGLLVSAPTIRQQGGNVTPEEI